LDNVYCNNLEINLFYEQNAATHSPYFCVLLSVVNAIGKSGAFRSLVYIGPQSESFRSYWWSSQKRFHVYIVNFLQ